MALSGIKASPEVVREMIAFKMNKIPGEYVVVKISDDGKELVLDTEFEEQLKEPGDYTDESERVRFDRLVQKLKAYNRPRYVLYELRSKTVEGRTIEKVALIFWNLDEFKIKDKMMYSSTMNTLTSAAELGSGLIFNIHGASDMDDYEDVLKKLLKS